MVALWREPFRNASKFSSFGEPGIVARGSLAQAEFHGRQFEAGCVGLLV